MRFVEYGLLISNCFCFRSYFFIFYRGIPGVSKNRKERIEAIGKYLSESDHNVVCLQEIWSEKDYLYLKETLKTNFPYAHYFYRLVYITFVDMY